MLSSLFKSSTFKSMSTLMNTTSRSFAILPTPGDSDNTVELGTEFSEHVQKVFNSSTWNRADIMRWQKKKVIQDLGDFPGDTGKPAVQGLCKNKLYTCYLICLFFSLFFSLLMLCFSLLLSSFFFLSYMMHRIWLIDRLI